MLRFIRKHLTIGMVDGITTVVMVIVMWMALVVALLHMGVK